MPQNTTNEKSTLTLVQVMALGCQTTTHCLIQSWHRYMLPSLGLNDLTFRIMLCVYDILLVSIKCCFQMWLVCHQISNTSRTLVGNKVVDHSDVVGAWPVGAAPTTSSFLDLTPGCNRLRNNNCRTRWETFKFWNLMRLILEIWRQSYLKMLCGAHRSWSKFILCNCRFFI